jgi:hypothetical protein
MNANGAPICYQWRRDGVDIPGAAGASYSLTAALTDSGARFSVIVSVLGADALSSEASLTVSTDTQGPVVIGAFSSLDGTNVTLKFNERLESVSAVDTFNYSIPGGFTILGAALQANQTDVLLGISPAMAVASTHQLTVGGIDDLAGNTMTSTQVVVRAHVITYGCVRNDLYLGLSAATVVLSDLTGAAAYPHSPSITRFQNITELNTVDEFEGYGTRMTGFLIPPVSGDYVFYFHSDDNGQFSLSTDASSVNLVLLCNEPVWSGRRTWVGEAGGMGRVGVPSASGGPQANISGPRNLMAGQMYYFEALMKEGGGGDNMGVTWQPPGGAVPVNNTPSAIPASALASLADPVLHASSVKGPAIVVTPAGPNMYRLSWVDASYQLEFATSVTGPWGPNPGGTASGVVVNVPASGNGFFRLRKP